ncbi:MAG: hypothetical protein CVU09_17590 [Bacteroidetes bacterium HGW-Bacteroidetes-4]|jgi:hypothetical protein|nr:MAG: hypothetical protein CVU09_17590 [Bacteroidetes bacterium HGW-Bacteroidetes-4]
MKKLSLLYLILLAVFASCNKLDKLTQFTLNYEESIVIPSSFGIELPFDIYTPEIESNTASTFSVNNTRKDLVEEISLKTLTLTLTDPSESNFSFLNEIHIYISAEGLDETEIAWKTNITDDTGVVLSLETTGVNLKDYILKDNFSLRVNTKTNKLLSADHYIDLDAAFFVDAKILGQ